MMISSTLCYPVKGGAISGRFTPGQSGQQAALGAANVLREPVGDCVDAGFDVSHGQQLRLIVKSPFQLTYASASGA